MSDEQQPEEVQEVHTAQQDEKKRQRERERERERERKG
jgi:hypothetical protein